MHFDLILLRGALLLNYRDDHNFEGLLSGCSFTGILEVDTNDSSFQESMQADWSATQLCTEMTACFNNSQTISSVSNL